MERIEVPQFETSDKRVIKERESYVCLFDDYFQYRYDADVVEKKEDESMPPEERRWFYDMRVLKSNITGCNVKKIYDKRFSFYGVAIWYVEGSTELIFEKHSTANEVMKTIWEWIKKPPV